MCGDIAIQAGCTEFPAPPASGGGTYAPVLLLSFEQVIDICKTVMFAGGDAWACSTTRSTLLNHHPTTLQLVVDCYIHTKQDISEFDQLNRT